MCEIAFVMLKIIVSAVIEYKYVEVHAFKYYGWYDVYTNPHIWNNGSLKSAEFFYGIEKHDSSPHIWKNEAKFFISYYTWCPSTSTLLFVRFI